MQGPQFNPMAMAQAGMNTNAGNIGMGGMPGGAMPGMMPGMMGGAMPGVMPAGYPFTPAAGTIPMGGAAPPLQQSHSGGGRFPYPKEKQPWDELDKFTEHNPCLGSFVDLSFGPGSLG